METDQQSQPLGYIQRPGWTPRRAAEEWAKNYWPDRWGSGGIRFDRWTPQGSLTADFVVWGGVRTYRIAWDNALGAYAVSALG
jgi:hypothetical protein